VTLRFQITALSRISLPLLGFAVTLALLPGGHAQQPPSDPQTIEEALHQMSDAAGVIFVGQVTAVRSRTGTDGASGLMEIDFRIDQAVRGCTSGSTYTLREWAGLWGGSDQRYRVGQRLLMLLHAPGPTGITSPVGGMTGAIPIRAATPAPQTASATTASSPLIADLRWVGTRLQRPLPYASSTLVTAQSAGPPSVSVTSLAAQQAPLSVVIGMLSSWQGSQ
jgi:hypothetical protein